MVKKYCSILLVLLFVQSIHSQGGTALPFLTFPQSPLLIGAGGIGAAIPIEDASGFYFNPAQLGNFSQENTFSLFVMPQKTKWAPNYKMDLSSNSFGFSFGYNFKKQNNDLPLSVGVGYLHNKFSYGKFVRTGPDSPDPIGTYESYDAFNCFSIGAGYGNTIRFNAGISIKSYKSFLGDSPVSSEMNWDGIDGTAFDFGVMLVTPISKLFFNDQKFYLSQESFLKPEVDFTLGYSLLNYGKEVVYADPAQKDPLPRTARLGYSFNIGLDMNINSLQMKAIDYSFTAEVDDILVKRDPNDGSPNYDNIFGAIGAKHLIALKGDNEVVVHRGHILRLFETFIIADGRFNTRMPDGMESSGFGFSSEGIMKLYSAFAGNSMVDYAAKHFILEYFEANNYVDSFIETNYRGLVLRVKSIEF